jgi:hypothetical protein
VPTGRHTLLKVIHTKLSISGQIRSSEYQPDPFPRTVTFDVNNPKPLRQRPTISRLDHDIEGMLYLSPFYATTCAQTYSRASTGAVYASCTYPCFVSQNPDSANDSITPHWCISSKPQAPGLWWLPDAVYYPQGTVSEDVSPFRSKASPNFDASCHRFPDESSDWTIWKSASVIYSRECDDQSGQEFGV